MKDNVERIQFMLEKATDTGSSPPDALDSEIASLREAWLAFGQMLETASPPTSTTSLCFREKTKYSPYSPLPWDEEQGVRAKRPQTRRHWRHSLASALLAGSLLVAIATAWMLSNANQQADAPTPSDKIASTDPIISPPKHSLAKSPAKADIPQWNDSLDESFAQVGWQMLCVRHNQFFRTDAFGVVEYQLQQFRQSIQKESL
jgi:hypothetical protein